MNLSLNKTMNNRIRTIKHPVTGDRRVPKLSSKPAPVRWAVFNRKREKIKLFLLVTLIMMIKDNHRTVRVSKLPELLSGRRRTRRVTPPTAPPPPSASPRGPGPGAESSSVQTSFNNVDTDMLKMYRMKEENYPLIEVNQWSLADDMHFCWWKNEIMQYFNKTNKLTFNIHKINCPFMLF